MMALRGFPYIISVVRDVSERKRADAQLHQAQAETERLLLQSERLRRGALSMMEDQRRANRKIHQLLDEAAEREFFGAKANKWGKSAVGGPIRCAIR